MAAHLLPLYIRFALGRLRARIHRACLRFAVSGWAAVLLRAKRSQEQVSVRTASPPQSLCEQVPLILVVDVAAPTPDRDSGSVRLLALLRALKGAGLQPVFATDDFLIDGPALAPLRNAGIAILPCRNARELTQWLMKTRGQLQALIASRHHTASHWIPFVKAISPTTRVVFDTVDLHFIRERREADSRGQHVYSWLAGLTQSREIHAVRMADSTWVVSPTEKELLVSLAPSADVQVVSNIAEPALEIPGFQDREGLLFIGGFRHSPNVDAVRWLLSDIFPLIRTRAPEIELDIVGPDMPRELREAASRIPGVRVLGHVPDITPLLLTRRVAVAPLRFGAGVKGKINSSMAHGQPVVATTCAIEGMYLEHEASVLTADSADEFCQQVIRAYYNTELWRSLAQGGLDNVITHFSSAAALATMLSSLNISSASSMKNTAR